MTKKEMAEVLVRFSGVVVCFLAFTKILKLIGSLGVFFTLMPKLFADSEIDVTTLSTLYATIPNIIGFIILCILGYILLKKNQRLIDFISKDLN
jgi:putative Mn2+ efflux pump MntP